MDDLAPIWGVLLAAGRGARFGRQKHDVEVDGLPLWQWAYRALVDGGVAQVVIDGRRLGDNGKVVLMTSGMGSRRGRTGSLGDYGDSKAALNDEFRLLRRTVIGGSSSSTTSAASTSSRPWGSRRNRP